jgi:triosephosphate isomerase
VTVSTPIIAGNWKLHNGLAATRAFFEEFLPRVPGDFPGSIVIFPPSLSLAEARDSLAGRADIQLGVQDIHWEESGAFTGEISATMAAEAGARFALVGHSERRHIFGESDLDAARKVRAAINAGLIGVLCVGEKLEEREGGKAFEVVERQLSAILTDGDQPPPAGSLVVAYEPVWAIGTGRRASTADAAEMHGRVRLRLGEIYGDAGAGVPILYGGSVKPGNAADLLAAPGIDGLLIGGASLDPVGFAQICALAT